MCGTFRNLPGCTPLEGQLPDPSRVRNYLKQQERWRPGYQEEFPSILAEALHIGSGSGLSCP